MVVQTGCHIRHTQREQHLLTGTIICVPQRFALLDKGAVNQTERPKICPELVWLQLSVLSDGVSLPALQKVPYLLYFAKD